MTDQSKFSQIDSAAFAEFLKAAMMVAREFKGRADLLERAEVELTRAVASHARFLRARDRLLAFGEGHPLLTEATDETLAADQASKESATRLYALSLLLAEDQAKAVLDRYQGTIKATPKGGRPAIV